MLRHPTDLSQDRACSYNYFRNILFILVNIFSHNQQLTTDNQIYKKVIHEAIAE